MSDETLPAMRKAQPACMRFLMTQLLQGSSKKMDQLVRVLIKEANYATTTANETVENAVQDGLLVAIANNATANSTRGARLNEHKALSLPKVEQIKLSTHDFYCYECHLPGNLENCRQCTRSFHRLCYRKDAERPNYAVPSAKFQKNQLPVFSDSSESSQDEDEENDSRACSSLLQLDQDITLDSTASPVTAMLTAYTSLHNGSANADIVDKLLLDVNTLEETETKLDVVCVGEVRPPTRKRPATTASSISYKSEISPNDEEEENAKQLCTCCRLLKSATLRNPANMKADELCHLIMFTFERNRSWLITDVPKFLAAMKLTDTELNIINKLLFRIPNQRLDDIALKLEKQEYAFLMEFLVDILDLQHAIGIFFGTYSTEMESTKWLVRDIVHDLSEIRRCPDCFRHSLEKRSSIWFAKPCVQRHELVFAKHSGFTYWPAKVIRVLPNSKYDVRFFGGSHSRALIDVRYIRPIDSDVKALKLGNSLAIKKALEELRYHQILSTYPPSKFSFYADATETQKIIQDLLQRGIAANDLHAATGRTRKTHKRKTKNDAVHIIEDVVMNTSVSLPLAAASVLTQQQQQQQKQQQPLLNLNTVDDSSADFGYETLGPAAKRRNSGSANLRVKRDTRSLNKTAYILKDLKKLQEELKDALKISEERMKKNKKLSAHVQKLKDTIKKHEMEKKILKRKQWCYWCLNEAFYLCCFTASYCSKVCQSRHWKEGHSKVCKNRDVQAKAAATATTTTTTTTTT